MQFPAVFTIQIDLVSLAPILWSASLWLAALRERVTRSEMMSMYWKGSLLTLASSKLSAASTIAGSSYWEDLHKHHVVIQAANNTNNTCLPIERIVVFIPNYASRYLGRHEQKGEFFTDRQISRAQLRAPLSRILFSLILWYRATICVSVLSSFFSSPLQIDPHKSARDRRRARDAISHLKYENKQESNDILYRENERY